MAFATGAAAESRKTIGWTVFGGMIAATTLAIFVVPVLFALITKLSYGKKLKRLQEEHKKEEEIDKRIIDRRIRIKCLLFTISYVRLTNSLRVG